MAINWKDLRQQRTNTNIDYRRSLGINTPWADYIDQKRESGGNTPYADWLGYGGDTVAPNTTKTPKEICSARAASGEAVVWNGTSCVPTGDTTDNSANDNINNTNDKVNDVLNNNLQNNLDVSKYANWVPQDNTQIPYTKLGAYSDAFQQMLNNPAFGNQTLEQLEQARINALQGDLANQFGYSADELQRRLNAEAEASGMFTSGARVGAIGRGLSELGRQQGVEFAKGAADIRGQRPELLLKQREQNANIANMWGQMDLESQRANLDAMLNNKLMEYDRALKNGELSISAFNGNVTQLGLFLDYTVSTAKTENDRALISAQIDKIYNDMTQEQKEWFWDWISNMGTGFGLLNNGLGGS